MDLQLMQLFWVTAAFFWMLGSAQPVLTESAGEALTVALHSLKS